MWPVPRSPYNSRGHPEFYIDLFSVFSVPPQKVYKLFMRYIRCKERISDHISGTEVVRTLAYSERFLSTFWEGHVFLLVMVLTAERPSFDYFPRIKETQWKYTGRTFSFRSFLPENRSKAIGKKRKKGGWWYSKGQYHLLKTLLEYSDIFSS